MNEVVKEWIAKSEGDFATAERELAVADDPNYDAVCFHSQQCVEKLMKAVLIEHEISPVKTHDLVQLHQQLEGIRESSSIKIEDLRFLTRAAVDFRYPGEFADREEAEKAVVICTEIRTVLLKFLRK